MASASTPTATPTVAKGLCRDCGRPGHWARHCPNRFKDKRQQEAPGQSTNGVSRTSCVEAKEKAEVTEEELE